jgi:hypothetical protein
MERQSDASLPTSCGSADNANSIKLSEALPKTNSSSNELLTLHKRKCRPLLKKSPETG